MKMPQGRDASLGPSDPRDQGWGWGVGSNVRAGEGPGLARAWKLLWLRAPLHVPQRTDNADQRPIKLLSSGWCHNPNMLPCQGPAKP